MEAQALNIEIRTDTGKGAARQLRSRGMVPGVFYGPGAEAVSLAVSPKELTHLLTGDYRRNTLLKLSLDGTEHLAMVKDLQVHPVTREILHVDLYKVALDRPVLAKVPLSTSGRAKGVVLGGDLNVVFRELPVRCAPDKIPASIVFDVTSLDLGAVVRVKDVPVPEGVELTLSPERVVISVAQSRRRAAAEAETAEAAAS